jgi:hypothetical protein
MTSFLCWFPLVSVRLGLQNQLAEHARERARHSNALRLVVLCFEHMCIRDSQINLRRTHHIALWFSQRWRKPEEQARAFRSGEIRD